MWIFVWKPNEDRPESLLIFPSLAQAWDELRGVQVQDVPDEFIHVSRPEETCGVEQIRRFTFSEFLEYL